jgi:cell division protein FtsX
MLSNYLKIFIRDGFKFLWRNKGVAFASVVTLAVALTITGFTMVFVNSGNQIVNHLQEQVEINAYVKNDVTRVDALNLAKEIEKMPGFESLEYFLQVLLLQHFQVHLKYCVLHKLYNNGF